MRSANEIQAELVDLNSKLKKRADKPGFAENVAAIRARIAECEAELGR